MFHRYKRLKAFTTGCLASLVVFGYPSQLLAQSNSMNNPVQGITSTTQEAPATAQEVNDVMTGLGAGVNINDLIQPKPDPIREHTTFLTSMWDVLLDSDYSAENSYLTTGEWITGPSGVMSAVNENNNSVEVDIALSFEILPAEFGYDQETLDTIASISARFGIAWSTISNSESVESNILIWWVEWVGPDGISTEIGPLTTVDQDDIDMLRLAVPLMGDFYDNPLHYNIDNYDPATMGLWSRYQNAIKTAAIIAVGVVLAVTVVGVIVVAASGAAAIAGAATTASVGAAAVKAGAAIVGAVIVAATGHEVAVSNAYNQLVEDLEAAGWDLTGFSEDEVLNLGKLVIGV